MTEYSGTITTGGTAQTVANPNPTRRRIVYQNNSPALLMFSATTGANASATVGLAVPGGQNQIYEWPQDQALTVREDGGVPKGAITVWGANTGQSYYVEESS